jgi:hypothetical protein
MRLRADRDDGRVPDPAAYWRRRFFILGGGIAVISVLAWQFTPAHPARAPGSSATARKAEASVAATNGTPLPSVSVLASPGAGQCAPGSVVLSLFTSQASYAPGKQPRFEIYAVSTAPSACLMAFGPGSVRVIVTKRGQVVWDSATCEPAPAAPVRFQLGVPRLMTISWNRAAAGPAGCAGSLPAGASGTFEAVAMSAGQDSSVRTFTLLR